MHLLLALFLTTRVSWADASLEVPRDTPVYQSTVPNARVLFYLHHSEHASQTPAPDPEFTRIRVNRKGKWYSGFVRIADVEEQGETPSGHEWGLSLGGQYTSLMQKGKNFEANDSVQYSTTDYKSYETSGFVSVQMSQTDFWRLSVAQKKTHYQAFATTDVVGTPVKPIDLQQTFISGLLQKAWMPLRQKNLYFGLGIEVAKATSVTLMYGPSVLTTTSQDLPTYFGVLAFVGGRIHLTQSWSLFGEGRVEYIANQAPAIYGLEGALGLVFWP